MSQRKKGERLFPSVDWKKYFREVQLGVREAHAHARKLSQETDGDVATLEALKQAEETLSILSKGQPDRQSALSYCRVLLLAVETLAKLATRLKNESPVESTHFLLAGLMLARTLPMILTLPERAHNGPQKLAQAG